MAKSSIISDFASEKISLKVTLNRLKVILNSFEDDQASYWLTKELTGYSLDDNIPSYRIIISGLLKGTYVIGYHKISNQSLPTQLILSDGEKYFIRVNNNTEHFCYRGTFKR